MSTIVKERSNVLNVEVSGRKNDVRGNVKGNCERRNVSELELHRGMIVFCHLSNNGSIQSGTRPIILVGNEKSLKYSSVFTAIPLTSRMTKKPLPTHVLLTPENTPCLLKTSIALGEQILSVNKSDIERVIGTVSDEIMQEVNKAMMIQLGLM